MQVTFLGTNGWFDTPTGQYRLCTRPDTLNMTLSSMPVTGLPRPTGTYRRRSRSYLFLSHFHIDHIAGLHTLVKFRLKQGLKIFCMPGGSALLHTFVRGTIHDTARETPVSRPISSRLEEGIHKIPFTVECRPLVHPAPCYGYRVEIDGKVIAFCTDTGVCDNAVALARDADLLITECGLKPGDSSPDWPHLNPQDAIGIAKRAKAKRLALVHFGAEVYKTLEERKAVQDEFGTYLPGLIVATDDLTVDV